MFTQHALTRLPQFLHWNQLQNQDLRFSEPNAKFHVDKDLDPKIQGWSSTEEVASSIMCWRLGGWGRIEVECRGKWRTGRFNDVWLQRRLNGLRRAQRRWPEEMRGRYEFPVPGRRRFRKFWGAASNPVRFRPPAATVQEDSILGAMFRVATEERLVSGRWLGRGWGYWIRSTTSRETI